MASGGTLPFVCGMFNLTQHENKSSIRYPDILVVSVETDTLVFTHERSLCFEKKY